jgi:hypothetical protein
MNTIRKFLISLGLVLLATPVISGQDLSRYRRFALGSSLPAICRAPKPYVEAVKSCLRATWKSSASSSQCHSSLLLGITLSAGWLTVGDSSGLAKPSAICRARR